MQDEVVRVRSELKIFFPIAETWDCVKEACESEDGYTNSPKVTASSKELLMKIMQSTSAESERQLIDSPGGGCVWAIIEQEGALV